MDIMDLKRCCRCVLPETFPGIKFDHEGICQFCRQAETVKNIVKKESRLEELEKFLSKYRGKGRYDCMVPFSGGKDSAYALYLCKKKFGMNPLAYNFNNHFQTDAGRSNVEKVLKGLNVDMVSFTPKWETAKKLCIKALEKRGDFCWFCNTGIWSTSIRRALIEGIKLIVFAEGEFDLKRYFTGKINELHFREVVQERIPETEFIGDGLSAEDLKVFGLPPKKELDKLDIVFMGHYMPWDKNEIVNILKKELGWQEAVVKGNSTTFEHIDCWVSSVREYLKFYKHGFGRKSQLASIGLRENKMTREEAYMEIPKDGFIPESLPDFYKTFGITEKDLFRIMEPHRNPKLKK
ncbi:MAG TPA: N-acetyl sugar amidotransferase [Victivallales bacterium]|nr:N-acetyl sugar amidotransferase [Victivallales bacterium]